MSKKNAFASLLAEYVQGHIMKGDWQACLEAMHGCALTGQSFLTLPYEQMIPFLTREGQWEQLYRYQDSLLPPAARQRGASSASAAARSSDLPSPSPPNANVPMPAFSKDETLMRIFNACSQPQSKLSKGLPSPSTWSAQQPRRVVVGSTRTSTSSPKAHSKEKDAHSSDTEAHLLVLLLRAALASDSPTPDRCRSALLLAKAMRPHVGHMDADAMHSAKATVKSWLEGLAAVPQANSRESRTGGSAGAEESMQEMLETVQDILEAAAAVGCPVDTQNKAGMDVPVALATQSHSPDNGNSDKNNNNNNSSTLVHRIQRIVFCAQAMQEASPPQGAAFLSEKAHRTAAAYVSATVQLGLLLTNTLAEETANENNNNNISEIVDTLWRSFEPACVLDAAITRRTVPPNVAELVCRIFMRATHSHLPPSVGGRNASPRTCDQVLRLAIVSVGILQLKLLRIMRASGLSVLPLGGTEDEIGLGRATPSTWSSTGALLQCEQLALTHVCRYISSSSLTRQQAALPIPQPSATSASSPWLIVFEELFLTTQEMIRDGKVVLDARGIPTCADTRDAMLSACASLGAIADELTSMDDASGVVAAMQLVLGQSTASSSPSLFRLVKHSRLERRVVVEVLRNMKHGNKFLSAVYEEKTSGDNTDKRQGARRLPPATLNRDAARYREAVADLLYYMLPVVHSTGSHDGKPKQILHSHDRELIRSLLSGNAGDAAAVGQRMVQLCHRPSPTQSSSEAHGLSEQHLKQALRVWAGSLESSVLSAAGQHLLEYIYKVRHTESVSESACDAAALVVVASLQASRVVDIPLSRKAQIVRYFLDLFLKDGNSSKDKRTRMAVQLFHTDAESFCAQHHAVRALEDLQQASSGSSNNSSTHDDEMQVLSFVNDTTSSSLGQIIFALTYYGTASDKKRLAAWGEALSMMDMCSLWHVNSITSSSSQGAREEQDTTTRRQRLTPLSQAESTALDQELQRLRKEESVKKAIALFYRMERDNKRLQSHEVGWFRWAVKRGPLPFAMHVVRYVEGEENTALALAAVDAALSAVFRRLSKTPLQPSGSMPQTSTPPAAIPREVLIRYAEVCMVQALSLIPQYYSKSNKGANTIFTKEKYDQVIRKYKRLIGRTGTAESMRQRTLQFVVTSKLASTAPARQACDALERTLDLCIAADDVDMAMEAYLQFHTEWDGLLPPLASGTYAKLLTLARKRLLMQEVSGSVTTATHNSADSYGGDEDVVTTFGPSSSSAAAPAGNVLPSPSHQLSSSDFNGMGGIERLIRDGLLYASVRDAAAAVDGGVDGLQEHSATYHVVQEACLALFCLSSASTLTVSGELIPQFYCDAEEVPQAVLSNTATLMRTFLDPSSKNKSIDQQPITALCVGSLVALHMYAQGGLLHQTSNYVSDMMVLLRRWSRMSDPASSARYWIRHLQQDITAMQQRGGVDGTGSRPTVNQLQVYNETYIKQWQTMDKYTSPTGLAEELSGVSFLTRCGVQRKQDNVHAQLLLYATAIGKSVSTMRARWLSNVYVAADLTPSENHMADTAALQQLQCFASIGYLLEGFTTCQRFIESEQLVFLDVAHHFNESTAMLRRTSYQTYAHYMMLVDLVVEWWSAVVGRTTDRWDRIASLPVGAGYAVRVEYLQLLMRLTHYGLLGATGHGETTQGLRLRLRLLVEQLRRVYYSAEASCGMGAGESAALLLLETALQADASASGEPSHSVSSASPFKRELKLRAEEPEATSAAGDCSERRLVDAFTALCGAVFPDESIEAIAETVAALFLDTSSMSNTAAEEEDDDLTLLHDGSSEKRLSWDSSGERHTPSTPSQHWSTTIYAIAITSSRHPLQTADTISLDVLISLVQYNDGARCRQNGSLLDLTTMTRSYAVMLFLAMTKRNSHRVTERGGSEANLHELVDAIGMLSEKSCQAATQLVRWSPLMLSSASVKEVKHVLRERVSLALQVCSPWSAGPAFNMMIPSMTRILDTEAAVALTAATGVPLQESGSDTISSNTLPTPYQWVMTPTDDININNNNTADSSTTPSLLRYCIQNIQLTQHVGSLLATSLRKHEYLRDASFLPVLQGGVQRDVAHRWSCVPLSTTFTRQALDALSDPVGKLAFLLSIARIPAGKKLILDDGADINAAAVDMLRHVSFLFHENCVLISAARRPDNKHTHHHNCNRRPLLSYPISQFALSPMWKLLAEGGSSSSTRQQRCPDQRIQCVLRESLYCSQTLYLEGHVPERVSTSRSSVSAGAATEVKPPPPLLSTEGAFTTSQFVYNSLRRIEQNEGNSIQENQQHLVGALWRLATATSLPDMQDALLAWRHHTSPTSLWSSNDLHWAQLMWNTLLARYVEVEDYCVRIRSLQESARAAFVAETLQLYATFLLTVSHGSCSGDDGPDDLLQLKREVLGALVVCAIEHTAMCTSTTTTTNQPQLTGESHASATFESVITSIETLLPPPGDSEGNELSQVLASEEVYVKDVIASCRPEADGAGRHGRVSWRLSIWPPAFWEMQCLAENSRQEVLLRNPRAVRALLLERYSSATPSRMMEMLCSVTNYAERGIYTLPADAAATADENAVNASPQWRRGVGSAIVIDAMLNVLYTRHHTSDESSNSPRRRVIAKAISHFLSLSKDSPNGDTSERVEWGGYVPSDWTKLVALVMAQSAGGGSVSAEHVTEISSLVSDALEAEQWVRDRVPGSKDSLSPLLRPQLLAKRDVQQLLTLFMRTLHTARTHVTPLGWQESRQLALDEAWTSFMRFLCTLADHNGRYSVDGGIDANLWAPEVKEAFDCLHSGSKEAYTIMTRLTTKSGVAPPPRTLTIRQLLLYFTGAWRNTEATIEHHVASFLSEAFSDTSGESRIVVFRQCMRHMSEHLIRKGELFSSGGYTLLLDAVLLLAAKTASAQQRESLLCFGLSVYHLYAPFLVSTPEMLEIILVMTDMLTARTDGISKKTHRLIVRTLRALVETEQFVRLQPSAVAALIKCRFTYLESRGEENHDVADGDTTKLRVLKDQIVWRIAAEVAAYDEPNMALFKALVPETLLGSVCESFVNFLLFYPHRVRALDAVFIAAGERLVKQDAFFMETVMAELVKSSESEDTKKREAAAHIPWSRLTFLYDEYVARNYTRSGSDAQAHVFDRLRVLNVLGKTTTSPARDGKSGEISTETHRTKQMRSTAFVWQKSLQLLTTLEDGGGDSATLLDADDSRMREVVRTASQNALRGMIYFKPKDQWQTAMTLCNAISKTVPPTSSAHYYAALKYILSACSTHTTPLDIFETLLKSASDAADDAVLGPEQIANRSQVLQAAATMLGRHHPQLTRERATRIATLLESLNAQQQAYTLFCIEYIQRQYRLGHYADMICFVLTLSEAATHRIITPLLPNLREAAAVVSPTAITAVMDLIRRRDTDALESFRLLIRTQNTTEDGGDGGRNALCTHLRQGDVDKASLLCLRQPALLWGAQTEHTHNAVLEACIPLRKSPSGDSIMVSFFCALRQAFGTAAAHGGKNSSKRPEVSFWQRLPIELTTAALESITRTRQTQTGTSSQNAVKECGLELTAALVVQLMSTLTSRAGGESTTDKAEKAVHSVDQAWQWIGYDALGISDICSGVGVTLLTSPITSDNTLLGPLHRVTTTDVVPFLESACDMDSPLHLDAVSRIVLPLFRLLSAQHLCCVRELSRAVNTAMRKAPTAPSSAKEDVLLLALRRDAKLASVLISHYDALAEIAVRDGQITCAAPSSTAPLTMGKYEPVSEISKFATWRDHHLFNNLTDVPNRLVSLLILSRDVLGGDALYGYRAAHVVHMCDTLVKGGSSLTMMAAVASYLVQHLKPGHLFLPFSIEYLSTKLLEAIAALRGVQGGTGVTSLANQWSSAQAINRFLVEVAAYPQGSQLLPPSLAILLVSQLSVTPPMQWTRADASDNSHAERMPVTLRFESISDFISTCAPIQTAALTQKDVLTMCTAAWDLLQRTMTHHANQKREEATCVLVTHTAIPSKKQLDELLDQFMRDAQSLLLMAKPLRGGATKEVLMPEILSLLVSSVEATAGGNSSSHLTSPEKKMESCSVRLKGILQTLRQRYLLHFAEGTKNTIKAMCIDSHGASWRTAYQDIVGYTPTVTVRTARVEASTELQLQDRLSRALQMVSSWQQRWSLCHQYREEKGIRLSMQHYILLCRTMEQESSNTELFRIDGDRWSAVEGCFLALLSDGHTPTTAMIRGAAHFLLQLDDTNSNANIAITPSGVQNDGISEESLHSVLALVRCLTLLPPITNARHTHIDNGANGRQKQGDHPRDGEVPKTYALTSDTLELFVGCMLALAQKKNGTTHSTGEQVIHHDDDISIVSELVSFLSWVSNFSRPPPMRQEVLDACIEFLCRSSKGKSIPDTLRASLKAATAEGGEESLSNHTSTPTALLSGTELPQMEAVRVVLSLISKQQRVHRHLPSMPALVEVFAAAAACAAVTTSPSRHSDNKVMRSVLPRIAQDEQLIAPAWRSTLALTVAEYRVLCRRGPLLSPASTTTHELPPCTTADTISRLETEYHRILESFSSESARAECTSLLASAAGIPSVEDRFLLLESLMETCGRHADVQLPYRCLLMQLFEQHGGVTGVKEENAEDEADSTCASLVLFTLPWLEGGAEATGAADTIQTMMSSTTSVKQDFGSPSDLNDGDDNSESAIFSKLSRHAYADDLLMLRFWKLVADKSPRLDRKLLERSWRLVAYHGRQGRTRTAPHYYAPVSQGIVRDAIRRMKRESDTFDLLK